MSEIPGFQTLDEAVEFWETHDSADAWDEMEPVIFGATLRRNLLTPNPIVLTHRPERCPRCGEMFEDSEIDYLASDNDQLVMIRAVPVLRCQGSGHVYMLENTFNGLERLLALERVHEVEPTTTLTVPVYSFESND